MKNMVIKNTSILLTLLLISTMAVGCSQETIDSEKILITKEEAYTIYYDTIKKFVPELMTEPQECDVDIKTRDEVTFLTEHFVRNTSVKIKSQNVDGKLQYYLLNEFPEANSMNFYCINDDKFYTVDCGLNEKGSLKEWNSSHIPSFIFPYLNTPFFKQDAITSFTAERKNSDQEVTFIINGQNMEDGFAYRVMKEIFPRPDDKHKLDDVKIVLKIDKDGVPKTMSTEISMSIFTDNGGLHAKKTLNMDFVFNKLQNVDFEIEKVISQYSLDTSSSK